MATLQTRTRAPSADMVGRAVCIYLNLHRPGYLSLRALDGPDKGRVIAHARALVLTDCRLVVSEAGRQRVLREQAKNVHAGIRGVIEAIAVSDDALPDFEAQARALLSSGRAVRYNPYETTGFIDRATLLPVRTAARVIAIGARVVASKH